MEQTNLIQTRRDLGLVINEQMLNNPQLSEHPLQNFGRYMAGTYRLNQEPVNSGYDVENNRAIEKFFLFCL